MFRSICTSLVLTVSAFALAPTTAEAIPNRCSWGDGSRGYNEGYDLERNLLDFIWNARFDCNRLEDFIASVNIPGIQGRTPSDYLRCRNAGISEAISDAIQRRQRECTRQCAENGYQIGELAGQIYCNVTREFGAHGGPTPLCSIASQQSCRAALYDYVSSNCQDARSIDTGFDQYVDLACAL